MRHPGDWEEARVLVTVKAYPNPSLTHGEAVCVAGVRLDRDEPELIRLWPMAHRHAAYSQRFAKYQVVHLRIQKSAADERVESYQPDATSVRTPEPPLGTAHGWRDRWAVAEPLVGATTMCKLFRECGVRAAPGPSLGIVEATVTSVKVEDGAPFTPLKAGQAAAAAQPRLDDDSSGVTTVLEPAPFTVKYNYRCADAACRGHSQSIVDWETGQAGRKWLELEGGDRTKVAQQLVTRYQRDLCDSRGRTYLYVGNQHKRLNTFMVLGVWSSTVRQARSLFGPQT